MSMQRSNFPSKFLWFLLNRAQKALPKNENISFFHVKEGVAGASQLYGGNMAGKVAEEDGA